MPFPGFGARRVAPASDNGTALPWWGWQQNNGVLLYWLCLWFDTADSNNYDYDNDDNNDGARGAKNGVSVLFQHQNPLM
eukprot:11887318-Ditylum_brightwellii.AAC.1